MIRIGILSFAHYHANFWSEVFRDSPDVAFAGVWDDDRQRGIHFLCVNASLRSQFEFVQQTWCNNPHFGGLHDNKDPIAGDAARAGEAPSRMTIPGRPTVRTAAFPRFVTVKAAGYFFMPSLTALRFLAGAQIPNARSTMT